MILLMDGVIYEEWTGLSHDELEGMVKEHYKEILGEASLYFDVKHKLKGGSIVAIPDGYCLSFAPDTLWVIEVELSDPDPSKHLLRQLGDFINGLSDPKAERELRDVLLDTLGQQMRDQVGKRVGQLHTWLEGLISSASLLVVTERATDEIRRRVASLRTAPKVYEFRTFRRQGAEAVHIHQFEPLCVDVPPAAPAAPPSLGSWPALWQELLDRTRRRGVPIPAWQKPHKAYWQGVSIGQGGIGGVHFEWLCWGRAGLGVELHFERDSLEENRRLLEPFAKAKGALETAVGEPLAFDQPWRKKWARLYVYREDESVRHAPAISEPLKEWAVETMAKFHNACQPVLDSLFPK